MKNNLPADFTLCTSRQCPSRGACLRALAVSHNPAWQSYANLYTPGQACEDFIPVEDEALDEGVYE
jgi:hypothetical protein